jgi:hypothetical protein
VNHGKRKESARPEKPAFSLEAFESGRVSVNPGWLKAVWNKWPGDETIEELLAALVKSLGSGPGKVEL